MHICFITNEYPKTGFPHGGLGTFVQTFAQLLISSGHQVSVIGLNYEPSNEEIVEDGISIYRIKPSKFKGLTWLLNAQKVNRKIREIHKKNQIQILETPELGLAFLTKIKEIKYIIRLHGGHHFFAEAENRGINRWKGFQEKKSFSKADAFIAVSNYVKTHTEKYLNYANKKTSIISNPIALEKFYVSDSNKQIPFSIVFAGTVCEKKGIRQLIQALPIVLEQFPQATLDVYGRDWLFPDGSSYLQFLKKQIPENCISKIVFHGAIAHDLLPEAYEKAQVCVFPSHMETQGLVAPEAMAMEKVVIFTQFGPGPETIQNQKTGLLCNPLDPNDIASQILWVFENQEQSKIIAKEARKFVLHKFNTDLIVSQNLDFYHQILSE